MAPVLQLEHFSPHVGQAFSVLASAGPPSLTLQRAEPLSGNPAAPRPPFALHFLGPVAMPLGQDTHRLQHPELGPLDIFLVPVGLGPQGLQYEAIFN